MEATPVFFEHVRFHHFYGLLRMKPDSKKQQKRLLFTLCSCQHAKSKLCYLGLAVPSLKDQPSKKLGRTISFGRIYKVADEDVRSSHVRTFGQPDVCRATLAKFRAAEKQGLPEQLSLLRNEFGLSVPIPVRHWPNAQPVQAEETAPNP